MNTSSSILVVLGCLILSPALCHHYFCQRAGLVNGIKHGGGNDPRSIEISESYWRRQQSSWGKDPAVWNKHQDTAGAIFAFKEGMGRDEAIELSLISAENPIRPLSQDERERMEKDFIRWQYYNRALGTYYLAPFVGVIFGIPWLLIVVGFSINWAIRRQFLAIVLTFTIPFVVMAAAFQVVKVLF
jgi:hypothetical protein